MLYASVYRFPRLWIVGQTAPRPHHPRRGYPYPRSFRLDDVTWRRRRWANLLIFRLKGIYTLNHGWRVGGGVGVGGVTCTIGIGHWSMTRCLGTPYTRGGHVSHEKPRAQAQQPLPPLLSIIPHQPHNPTSRASLMKISARFRTR